jgi:hypothetical protein
LREPYPEPDPITQDLTIMDAIGGDLGDFQETLQATAGAWVYRIGYIFGYKHALRLAFDFGLSRDLFCRAVIQQRDKRE